MKRFLTLFSLVVFLLSLAACGGNSSGSNPADGMTIATLSGSPETTNLKFTPFPTQVSSTSNEQPSGDILFQDDFSNPSSGWDNYENEDGQVTYGSNEYIVKATTSKVVMWGYYPGQFSDLKIDVDAQSVTAFMNNNDGFGVDCRVQENGDGYSFEISSDGMYAIKKFTDTQSTSLIDWTDSPDIPTNGQIVHITASCVGNTMTLWVNGVEIASTIDDTYSSGGVSLSAVSFTDGQTTEVHFTNYLVTKPD